MSNKAAADACGARSCHCCSQCFCHPLWEATDADHEPVRMQLTISRSCQCRCNGQRQIVIRVDGICRQDLIILNLPSGPWGCSWQPMQLSFCFGRPPRPGGWIKNRLSLLTGTNLGNVVGSGSLRTSAIYRVCTLVGSAIVNSPLTENSGATYAERKSPLVEFSPRLVQPPCGADL
jgi:hypothetical protein